jgi:hypothetical protein
VTATVLIQSGHCYRTKGSTGTAGEQDFNTACADAAVVELRKRGYAAQRILADVPLRDYRCDVFVAIHGDGSTSSKSHGGSVGWRDSKGKALAQAWKAAYVDRGWTSGFHADNYTEALHFYYGTGNALALNSACRAVIVEGGFLTSPDDRAAMTSAEGHRRMALAIADAVDKTFGRKPPAPPAPPVEEDDDMKITDKIQLSQTETITGAQIEARNYNVIQGLPGKLDALTDAMLDVAAAVREGKTPPPAGGNA